METVELRDDSEFTLVNLQPDTEYIVTVIALYNGEVEGPPATAPFKIGTQTYRDKLTHSQFMLLKCFLHC